MSYPYYQDAKADWILNGGHGLKNDGSFDPGAIGPTGLREADVTNALDDIVAYHLSQAHENVLDVYEDGDLSDITARANSLDKAGRKTYFVSIHLNSEATHTADGTEVYALQAGGPGEALAKIVDQVLCQELGTNNRGVKFANFWVLKYTEMSAILIEVQFISNAQAESKFKQEAYKQAVGKAIAKALLAGVGKQLAIPAPVVTPPPVAPPPPAPVVDTEKEQLKEQVKQLTAERDQLKAQLDTANAKLTKVKQVVGSPDLLTQIKEIVYS